MVFSRPLGASAPIDGEELLALEANAICASGEAVRRGAVRGGICLGRDHEGLNGCGQGLGGRGGHRGGLLGLGGHWRFLFDAGQSPHHPIGHVAEDAWALLRLGLLEDRTGRLGRRGVHGPGVAVSQALAAALEVGDGPLAGRAELAGELVYLVGDLKSLRWTSMAQTTPTPPPRQ